MQCKCLFYGVVLVSRTFFFLKTYDNSFLWFCVSLSAFLLSVCKPKIFTNVAVTSSTAKACLSLYEQPLWLLSVPYVLLSVVLLSVPQVLFVVLLCVPQVLSVILLSMPQEPFYDVEA